MFFICDYNDVIFVFYKIIELYNYVCLISVQIFFCFENICSIFVIIDMLKFRTIISWINLIKKEMYIKIGQNAYFHSSE